VHLYLSVVINFVALVCMMVMAAATRYDAGDL